MSAHCTHHADESGDRPGYRKVLWFALVVNAAMFLVELGASASAGSAALAADAADFAGDAGNYALSLAAIAAGGAWASRAALAKGVTMAAYAIGVLCFAGWRLWSGAPPEAFTMGTTGIAAFAANLAVAWALYRFRDGDANMRSVWLCTRNDVLGNLAVVAAALGVFGTGTAWPDLFVAAVMAALALHSAREVIAHARGEMRSRPHADALDSGTPCG